MTKETIKIQPMEEWLEDRMDLLEAKLSADRKNGQKRDEALEAELELLKTIHERLKGE